MYLCVCVCVCGRWHGATLTPICTRHLERRGVSFLVFLLKNQIGIRPYLLYLRANSFPRYKEWCVLYKSWVIYSTLSHSPYANKGIWSMSYASEGKYILYLMYLLCERGGDTSYLLCSSYASEREIHFRYLMSVLSMCLVYIKWMRFVVFSTAQFVIP